MRITEVTEADLLTAGTVHAAAWRQSHREICTAEFVAAHTPQRQAGYLREQLQAGKQLWLLLDDAETAVGVVSLEQREGCGLIENLYVLPEVQNHGFGTQLLQFALDRCRKLALRPLLWVLNTNTGARRLYARLGFVETGRCKPLQNSLCEIEMTRY